MRVGIHQQMSPTEWLMLLGLSVLWGGSFFLVELAIRSLPPLTIVTIRVGLAALTLWSVLLLRHIRDRTACRRPPGGALIRACLIMGLLNNAVPFTLIVWGQTQIASGLASILNATTPFFTILIAQRFLADEALTRLRLAGVLAGVTGVAVMFAPSLTGLSAVSLPGQLAVLGAALSYGAASVHGRRFRALGASPLHTATGQLTASSLMLLPLALLLETPFQLPMPSSGVWAALVVLALACTAGAYLLYFRILATAGATNIALVTLLVPVTAVILGALFLGERLDAWQMLGMAIIALGLLLIDGRLFLRNKVP